MNFIYFITVRRSSLWTMVVGPSYFFYRSFTCTHAIHTMEEEEIEVNFRLDGAGRTTALSSSDAIPAAAAAEGKKMDYTTQACATRFGVLPPRRPNDAAHASPAASTDASSAIRTSKGIQQLIQSIGDSPLYDELLLDCEIADSGLMPRTFWVPAEVPATANNHTNADHSFQPRCTLEQMARDIFRHHTASVGVGDSSWYDPVTSGAEWWVQLRPSPEKTGRYAMHAHRGADDDERNGISFHWDKDEDLRLLCGGTTYVHPHLSTVTYLTGIGAPTLVAEGFRIHSLTGEWQVPPPQQRDLGNDEMRILSAGAGAAAFISWPRTGKHLSFDGRYLHAAPADLQEPGAFAEQCRVVPPPEEGSTTITTVVGVDDGNNNDDAEQKRKAALQQRRRHRRCTFLVNIWLNYKPFNVHPFPDTMIDKMSGYHHSQPPASSSSSPAETGNGDGLGQQQASSSPRLSLSFHDPTQVVGEAADRDDSASTVTTVIVQSDLSVKIMCSRDSSTDDDPPPLPLPIMVHHHHHNPTVHLAHGRRRLGRNHTNETAAATDPCRSQQAGWWERADTVAHRRSKEEDWRRRRRRR